MTLQRQGVDLAGVRLLLLDFDGVLTDNRVWISDDGRESVACTRADGIGLSRLRRLGIPCAIVSTETNPVVGHRARKLGLAFRQAVEDKGVVVRDLAAEHGVPLAQVAFMGNDVNDLPAFAEVGLRLCPADAHPRIRGLADLVTTLPGGQGCVREVCDLIADAIEATATAPQAAPGPSPQAATTPTPQAATA